MNPWLIQFVISLLAVICWLLVIVKDRRNARIARLVPLRAIYAAADAAGPRMVDHRCESCGAIEERTSPPYTSHLITCEAMERYRTVYLILMREDYRL